LDDFYWRHPAFCDSCRTSSRQTKDGFIFGFQGIWKWKVWDFAARIGFLLVTVGFALQLPAACAAK
jgi:hypothetical protein